MPFSRPIVLIENDLEDQELIAEAYSNLQMPFPLRVFENGADALDFLRDGKTIPFIVISDINMPGLNGFEVRDIVLSDDSLKHKCTPYIFLTDANNVQTAIAAYSRQVQGLFCKPHSHKELRQLLDTILNYWRKAIDPHKN